MPARGQITKNTVIKINSILNLLKKRKSPIHLRGISSELKINPSTVERIITNYLGPFIDIAFFDQFGYRAKVIGLKKEKQKITIEDVLSYIEIKKRIKAQPG